MNWRYKLDGTAYDNPKGWDEVIYTLERSDKINGVLYEYSSSLSFCGEGYEYIKDQMESTSFCDIIEVDVELLNNGVYEVFFEGAILVKDIELDYDKRQANVNLSDRAYATYINNNSDIKVRLKNEETKNGAAITPPSFVTVALHIPSTGGGRSGTHKGIRYSDALEYLVGWMSDGELSYSDTIFGSAQDYEGFFFQGKGFRVSTSEIYPVLSFKEAFENLHKKHNIVGVLQGGTLTVKKYEDGFSDTISKTLESVSGITKKIAQDLLYHINVGSDETKDSGTRPTGAQVVTHEAEEYLLVGNCNTANDLDLISSYVIDNNIIEDIVVTGVNSYDKDIIMVKTNGSASEEGTLFGGTTAIYNEAYLNNNVLSRFENVIPAKIKSTLQSETAPFYAEIGADDTTHNPQSGAYSDGGIPIGVPFDANEVDTGSQYDAVTNYIFEPSADGLYQFEAGIHLADIEIFDLLTVSITFQLIYDLDGTDTGPSLSKSATYTKVIPKTTTDITIVHAFPFYIDQSVEDYGVNVKLEIDVDAPIEYNFTIKGDSYFKSSPITFSFDNEGEVRIYEYEFTYPVCYEDFVTINADTSKAISFGNENITKSGWIKKLDYEPNKGLANFNLIAKS